MNPRVSWLVILAILLGGAAAHSHDSVPATAVLTLADGSHVQRIAVRASVDGLPYRDAWMRTFGKIFEFADADASGTLDEDEARLIPSARSVRLALGTGFTPPVSQVRSVRNEILAGREGVCDKAALERYYVRHGIGCLPIGHGTLTHSTAVATAFIRELDRDGDARLSEAEFQRAEAILKRLDTNDDELVGLGELVVGATYPGKAADHVLMPSESVELSSVGGHRLVLQRLSDEGGFGDLADAPSRVVPTKGWEIVATGAACRHSMERRAAYGCEAWHVRGRLPQHLTRLGEEVIDRADEPTMMTDGGRESTDRRPWLNSMADRDGDKHASTEEIQRWLALQRQIIAGHLLVSIHSGGGIFEVLDQNHDAALSIRELRDAWRVVEAADFSTEGRVDPARIPNQILFVVSHGYPSGLAKDCQADVEWFVHMDRNGDDDVSRREFTGPPDVFERLDADGDGLVSATEANAQP